jgi:hypothetical protein
MQEPAETQALDCLAIFGFGFELGIGRHHIHLALALDPVPRIGEHKEFGRLFSQAGIVKLRFNLLGVSDCVAQGPDVLVFVDAHTQPRDPQ